MSEHQHAMEANNSAVGTSSEKRHINVDDANGYDADVAPRKAQKVDTKNTQRIRDVILRESRGYDIASPNNIPKRSDYLSWDNYFMAVAYLSAQRSKDPHPSKNARDGACIVDKVGRIVGIGYDGFPRGCSDDCLPWASAAVSTASSTLDVVGESPYKEHGGKEEVTKEELAWLHTRDPFLCHAEINAILNKCSNDVVGGRMFVPNFPCEYDMCRIACHALV